MVEFLSDLEPRRGCGYRKVGKLYLRAAGLFRECHRLPYPLTVCPVCGGGVKFARGWIRLNARKLFGTCKESEIRCPHCGELMEETDEFLGRKLGNLWVCQECNIAIERHSKDCTCDEYCSICNPPEKVFMLWVGEKYYPTPLEFINEAIQLGVSKAVPSIPKDFILGETRVYLAHRKAVTMYVKNEKERLGYEIKRMEGIFASLIPTHFEMLVYKSEYEANKEKYIEMEERGIKIIVVPDNYDEMVKKAEEEFKQKISRRKKKKAVNGLAKLTT